MSEQELLGFFVCGLVFAVIYWIQQKTTPEYLVLSVSKESGYEVRYDGRSIWKHITDEEKINSLLKSQQELVLNDLKGRYHE